jgi:GLTT repeat (6 copies)
VVPPGFDVPGFEPGFEVPGFEPGFEVPGFEPGFVVPGLVDPPLGVVPGFVDDPGLVEPGLVEPGLVAPGLVAPGLVAPGLAPVFGLFGFVVEGCVLGVFGFVGFDPGAVLLPEPVGGGVVLLVGGRPVFPVGGAEGEDWPGVAEPPAAPAVPAPPPAPAPPACATTQVAQPRTKDSKANFVADFMRPPALNFDDPFAGLRNALVLVKESTVLVCSRLRGGNIRQMQ